MVQSNDICLQEVGKRPLELQISVHPSFSFNRRVKTPLHDFGSEVRTFQMLSAYAAISTSGTAVMTFAYRQNLLAEDSSPRIVLAYAW